MSKIWVVLLTIAGELVGLLVGGILTLVVFFVTVCRVTGVDSVSTGEMTTASFLVFIFGPPVGLLGAILGAGAGGLAAVNVCGLVAKAKRRAVDGVSKRKMALAVLCLLAGPLLSCISIIIFGLVGLYVYDGEDLNWGLTAVWFLVPVFSILSFIVGWRLWRSAKRQAERRWQSCGGH